MSEPLPNHLQPVLALLVEGYEYDRIAERLALKRSSVYTYIRDLKAHFSNEPEMQEPGFSPKKALVLVGQRYIQNHHHRLPDLLAPSNQHRVWMHTSDNAPDPQFALAEELLSSIQRILSIRSDPASFQYFAPMQRRHLFSQIDCHESQLRLLLRWLLDRNAGPLKHFLLVEFGTALPHYMDMRGWIQERLDLTGAAADAAKELGYKIKEGWLRCDALAWTLMEHYCRPDQARTQLLCALQLARDISCTEMAALATTFLARTYLMEGKLYDAQCYLDQATALECSPPIQARIYRVAGDLAFVRRDADSTIRSYEQADKVHTDVGTELKVGESYLMLHDAVDARKQFMGFMEKARIWGSNPPHMQALAAFGLARAAYLDGDLVTARQLADEAISMVQNAKSYPRLEQDKRRFIAFRDELPSFPIYMLRHGRNADPTQQCNG